MDGAQCVLLAINKCEVNMSDPAQSIDVTAPTLEEAIEDGLAQLGLNRNDVIIEIVEEGSKGVLGMGVRDAVVRLTALRPSPQAEQPKSEPPPKTTEEDVAIAREVLEELLGQMKIDAAVSARQAEPSDDEDEESPWILDIQGGDLGVLIGRRGETLNALQYITRLIVSRELQRRVNIVLDVEGYKLRREASLQRLARNMAEQARKLGRVMSLEPMPPNERRIIHITLRDDKTVRTESVGMGNRRKVTIIPENQNQNYSHR
jgi:spoIIIJ-associated protein